MRFAEYAERLARLEAGINLELAAETRAAAGEGSWFDHMIPSRFQSKIERAAKKRAALLRERTRLMREFMGGPAAVHNIDLRVIPQRWMPVETVRFMQNAARAAIDDEKTAGDGR